MRLFAASALLAIAFAPVVVDASPIELRARALSVTLTEPAEGVEALGGWTLSSRTPRFGGLSGAAWGDGDVFLAVSDQGLLLTVQTRREASGAVAQFGAATYAALLDRSGAALRGRGRDAEGLARLGGALWISFERRHRLELWRDASAPAQRTLPFPDFGLERNAGLEGVAIDLNGALYVVVEEPLQDAPGVLSLFR